MRTHIAFGVTVVVLAIGFCPFLPGCGGNADRSVDLSARQKSGSTSKPAETPVDVNPARSSPETSRHDVNPIRPDSGAAWPNAPIDKAIARIDNPPAMAAPGPSLEITGSRNAPGDAETAPSLPKIGIRLPEAPDGAPLRIAAGSTSADIRPTPGIMAMKGAPPESVPSAPAASAPLPPAHKATESPATPVGAAPAAPIQPQPAARSRSQAVGSAAGSGRPTLRRPAASPSLAIRPRAAPAAAPSSPREAAGPAVSASPRPAGVPLAPERASDSRSSPPTPASLPAPPATGAVPTEQPAPQPKAAATRSEPPGEAVASSDDPPQQAKAPQPVGPPGEEDYKTVTVFYGTDREALDVPLSQGWTCADWGCTTAIFGSISLVLGAIVYRRPGSRLLLALTGTAVLTTALLGIVTLQAGLRGKPVEPGTTRAYGNERGEMELGTCQVSIPNDHQVGEIERPSVFRLEFQEDPRRHVVLLSVSQQPEDEFFAALRARVDGSAKKEALVFVHGFDTTFEAAAQRTAQLAHDLRFDGAPILFSWPSQGGVLRYAVDETNVAWSTPHLKEFLLAVARRSGAKSINVIAHSMGNRALTSALHALSYRLKDEPPLFREVVLTAPDIDADVFKRDIAPAIVKTAARVTLYASSNDEALKVSREIHGYPRAGDSGRNVVVMPGMDTIDVSTVDTSLIGHSYYGSNDTVLSDLVDLINESKPPDQRRWLRPVPAGELSYWVFTSPRSKADTSRQPEGASGRY